MTTSVLSPDDFALYRDIRLAALATDPAAFCSTHERESAFDEATWRARLVGANGRPGAVIVHDGPDGSIAGVVGVGPWDTDHEAMLWGMWVRPDARGTGVGERLIGHAVEWCHETGLGSVALWVVVSNLPAIALYERCGFTATGAMDVVPGRPGVAEVQMRRRLGARP